LNGKQSGTFVELSTCRQLTSALLFLSDNELSFLQPPFFDVLKFTLPFTPYRFTGPWQNNDSFFSAQAAYVHINAFGAVCFVSVKQLI
jgi:hypothetical protein